MQLLCPQNSLPLALRLLRDLQLNTFGVILIFCGHWASSGQSSICQALRWEWRDSISRLIEFLWRWTQGTSIHARAILEEAGADRGSPSEPRLGDSALTECPSSVRSWKLCSRPSLAQAHSQRKDFGRRQCWQRGAGPSVELRLALRCTTNFIRLLPAIWSNSSKFKLGLASLNQALASYNQS